MKKIYDGWLIASDIDGTLNSNMRTIPKRNSKAVRNFIKNGGSFTLASGRPVQSLEREYKKINPNQPAVVLNGAGIYDFKRSEMIWKSEIGEGGRQFVRETLNRFSRGINRVEAGIFFEDKIYIVRAGVLSLGQMFFDRTSYSVKSIDDVPSEGWLKVIFWGNPSVIKKIENSVGENERKQASFMESSFVSFEMLAANTHKGTAVMELAKMIGIDKSHVAAIGNYYNDWDMLRTVGLPACAGQSPKPIKEICAYKACHCNKGCVADLISYIGKEACCA